MLEDGRRHCATVVLTLRGRWGQAGSWSSVGWPPLHDGVWRKWLALFSVVCATSEASSDWRWFKSKLTVHKRIYDSIKQKVTNLVDKAKQVYYSAKIQSSTTCKQLFQNFNTIFGKKLIFTSSFNVWRPPECLFWLLHWKIRTIRNNFPPLNPPACPDNSFVGNPLLTFEPVTDEFVLKKRCTRQVL